MKFLQVVDLDELSPVMFSLSLGVKSPKEAIFSRKAKFRTCRCIPFMHFVLSMAGNNKDSVSIILCEFIKRMKHMRVGLKSTLSIPCRCLTFHW